MRLFAALSLALLVASPALTQIPGPKKDGSTLFPNGWSIRPHGRQIPLESDLPIRAAWHPGGRILAIQHAGYREHRIVLFDAKSEKKLGKIELPRTWSGMCWHPGGDWLFVSGGTADVVHGFEIDTKTGRSGPRSHLMSAPRMSSTCRPGSAPMRRIGCGSPCSAVPSSCA
jgi:WD40 repeat protein